MTLDKARSVDGEGMSTEREWLEGLNQNYDPQREALERIAVACDNGATSENKIVFIREVARKALGYA